MLIETGWVLESVYEYRRENFAVVFDALLRMVRVLTEDADVVRSAIREYRGGADFADALIAGRRWPRLHEKRLSLPFRPDPRVHRPVGWIATTYSRPSILTVS